MSKPQQPKTPSSPWPALARIRRFLSRRSGAVSPAIIDAMPPRVRPLIDLDEFEAAAHALGTAHLPITLVMPIGFLQSVDAARAPLTMERAEYLRRRTLRYLLGDYVLATASQRISQHAMPDCLSTNASPPELSGDVDQGQETIHLHLTQPERDALTALSALEGVPADSLLANAMHAELVGRISTSSRLSDPQWSSGWSSSALTGRDEALKVWLPQIVWDALQRCAKHMDVDATEYTRRRLARYLWGDRVLAHLMEQVAADNDATRRNGIRFSRSFKLEMTERERSRIYRAPELGTNAVAAKFWISKRMHADLTHLCEQAGDLAPSKLAREILAGDLLGRATLPERLGLLNAPAHGSAWESGDTVPLVEVSKEQTRRLPYHEVEETQSDDKA
jgi:hypothetical protein